ncbi:MAG: TM1812 family CRISPR-associated protein [Oscillospiraceae bacterium]
MKNILVAYISTINPKAKINGFSAKEILGEDITIYGLQTNETAIKCLDLMLKRENKAIDKIICILSNDARNTPLSSEEDSPAEGYTAFRYLKEVGCKDISPAPEFREILTYNDDRTNRTSGELLAEICSEIGSDDTVYIDTTGGPRNALDLIQLLTKILKYKGVLNPCSFYANIQGKSRFIQTTEETNLMLDIADAVNEFVHTGQAGQLSSLFNEDAPQEISELIYSMTEFSEEMQLCSVDHFEDILVRMHGCIEAVKRCDSDEISIVILKNLLPVIESKFFGSGDVIDTCAVIEWCLDNGLIQQAVTVYIEMIPKYIFSKGIITYTDKLYNEVMKKTGDNPAKSNTEAEIFYSEIMDSVQSERKKRIEKLKTDIGFMDMSLKTSSENDAVIKVLKSIRQESGDDFRAYIRRAIKNTDKYDDIKAKLISVSCKEKFSEFKSLTNHILNKESLIAELLSLPPENENTFDKKLRTAQEITYQSIIPGAAINERADIRYIRRIMLDYIYVKSVRNRINHASSDENLNSEQRKIFEAKGYRMKMTIGDISENIRGSVELLRKMTNEIKD